ncbi:MAG: L,D-transpeptidase [Gemmatimonadaceae bacterium]
MSSLIARGGRFVWGLIASVILLAALNTLLFANTLEVRYERDVSRMVFNDNTELLDDLRRRAGLESDSLARLLTSIPEPTPHKPYLVVSIEEHRLWYRQGDSVLFTAEVATGSGKVLERAEGDTHWRFETPRGRLTVESKETDPVWIPPDWHYVEQAQKRGLGIVRLSRGQRIPTSDGGVITVAGSDVVKQYPDGRLTRIEAGEDREMVAEGNLIIPPFGTNQRKYKGVLGTHRLNIGDGYALHGTNKPETIGRSVSHGCVRLRNEDIATLYDMVPTGTPVFIY